MAMHALHVFLSRDSVARYTDASGAAIRTAIRPVFCAADMAPPMYSFGDLDERSFKSLSTNDATSLPDLLEPMYDMTRLAAACTMPRPRDRAVTRDTEVRTSTAVDASTAVFRSHSGTFTPCRSASSCISCPASSA